MKTFIRVNIVDQQVFFNLQLRFKRLPTRPSFYFGKFRRKSHVFTLWALTLVVYRGDVF